MIKEVNNYELIMLYLMSSLAVVWVWAWVSTS